jgi:hypothetical protein
MKTENWQLSETINSPQNYDILRNMLSFCISFSEMREFIEKVKDSITIESIVGETVSLKRSGANLKSCCPLHNEKTPSFFVRPSAQTFHCYGCGKNGDVIQFVIERDSFLLWKHSVF